MIPLNHVLPLLLSIIWVFATFIAIYNPRMVIRGARLPERIASSGPAQTIMIIKSAHLSATGLAVLVFLYQENYAAVDTVLMCLGIMAMVEGYAYWREGLPGTAVYRTVPAVLIGGWGRVELTAW